MDEIEGIKLLLGAAKVILVYFYTLLSCAQTQLQELEHELDLLRALLRDASEINKDERFRSWERRIRDVIHEAENCIAECAVHTADERNRSILRRKFGCLSRKSISLAERVKALRRDRVGPIISDRERHDFVTMPVSSRPVVDEGLADVIEKNPREKNVIPLDKEMDELINGLTAGSSENLEVFSIVSMAGSGKTTLARRIYRDPRIRDVFPIVVWVKISHAFNKKEVCLAILEELGEKDLPEMTDDQLAATIRTRLEKANSVMILDDVWTAGVWREIKDFLPIDGNHQCKVLITTRDCEVAKHASPGKLHELRPLCSRESWELIQLDIFGNLDSCPPELEDIGKQVAQDCNGLPFTIVMMAGVLKDKWITAQGITEAKKEWRRVSETLRNYGGSFDQDESFSKIISLSFNTLTSPGLKDCFLYLGMFPEGTDIQVQDLISMWVAQDCIVARDGSTLEEIGQDHLKELIDKNLLMVSERKPDGEVKTCRVHGIVCNFSKKEIAKQGKNMSEEIQLSAEGIFTPEVEEIKICRHICIHSCLKDFLMIIRKRLNSIKASSFLSFSKETIILEEKHMTSFTNAFKSLRVLHVKNAIMFPKFPAKLLLLKYISLSGDGLHVLPKTLSKLCTLQTLELDTSSPTVDCKANIWKLVDLRHLKTKASVTLSNLNGKGDGGDRLQTLKRISPRSCSSKLFCRLKNLRDLGIRGNLAKLLGTKHGLDELHLLDKLELVNGLTPEEAEKNPMPGLPRPNEFPPNVRSIKFKDTYLGWDNMSVLAQVGSLEVLKLKNHAFTGGCWDATSCYFNNLESLHMEDIDLRLWAASKENFPKLRKLVLINCKNLECVPDDLVKGLHLLHMEGASEYAVACAQKIGKEMQQMQGQRPGQKGRFQLKIVPREDDYQYTFASDRSN